MKLKSIFAAAVFALGATGSAFAAGYPTPGVENAVNYVFEGTGGDVKAYFVSSSAAYTSFLEIDGTLTALSDHGGPAWIDFGPVAAGQHVTFELYVNDTHTTWSSDSSLNTDSHGNHVYSQPWSEGSVAGVLLAWEDLPKGGSDYDYNDAVFGVTNVAVVPEPANVALLLAGLGLMGFVARRRRG
jgi:hypothetical protein